MARKPGDNSARMAFAMLLRGHLAGGTQPATPRGEPWTDAAFAGQVSSSRVRDDYVSDRTVSNWRKGSSLPSKIEPILQALFGPEANAWHTEAREALRQAFSAALQEKYAAVVKAAPADPAGPTFIVSGDQLTIDRTPRRTDQQAAADPLRQQLQAMIHDLAASLVEPAKRLANTRTWVRLPKIAADFLAVVAGDPMEMPQRLGLAYALMVQLGQFLETDIRVQRDPASSDDPLDPDIHGLLINLVRIAAPWLRGFPTVAAWDDAADRALIRTDLFQPAREFMRKAREEQLIQAEDAAEIDISTATATAAKPSDFQGAKAIRRTMGAAKNLVLATIRIAFTLFVGAVGSDFSIHSALVKRASALLTAAETEVEAIAETMPNDLRQAILAVVKQIGSLDTAIPVIVPSAASPPPPPGDIEVAARDLILDGRAPPAEWHPFIRRLDLSETGLNHLDNLSGLTALTSLNLMRTQVSDVSTLSSLTALATLDLTLTQVGDMSALSGLTTLTSLSLWGTQVGDVSALSCLTALKTLDLRDTRVNDVSALSGLMALTNLYLASTKVSNVSALSGLTALTSLDLSYTRVGDVSALSDLAALVTLNLENTLVNDVSPLYELTKLANVNLMNTQLNDVSALYGLAALMSLNVTITRVSDMSRLSGLTALKSLNLGGTGAGAQVSDVSHLSGLTALTNLVLRLTEVSEVSALSGLTALTSLVLSGTRVSDVSALSSLTGLETLYLNGTQVSDVSALSGLTALRYLNLQNTRVTDISPLAHLTNCQILR